MSCVSDSGDRLEIGESSCTYSGDPYLTVWVYYPVYFPYLTRAVQVAPTFFILENHNQNVRIRMVASQKFVDSAGSAGVALSSSEPDLSLGSVFREHLLGIKPARHRTVRPGRDA